MTLKHRVATLEGSQALQAERVDIVGILSAGRNRMASAEAPHEHTKAQLEHIAATAPKHSLAAAVARARLRVKAFTTEESQ